MPRRILQSALRAHDWAPQALLVALSAVALAGVALLLAAASWLEHQRRIAATGKELAADVRLLAEQTETAVKAVELVLREVEATVREDGGLAALAQPAFLKTMRRQLDSLPQLSNLVVLDAEGRMVQSGVPIVGAAPTWASLAWRRADESGWLVGAVLDSAGRRVLPLGRRLHDAQGAFVGVAVAALPLTYFERLQTQLRAPLERRFALLLNDGSVLSVVPTPPSLRGSLEAVKVAAWPQARSRSLWQGPSPLDGSERLFAFEGLLDQPLVVSLSVDLAQLRGQLYPQLARNLGIFLLFAGFTVLAVRLLRREMAKVECARNELQVAYQQMREMAVTDELTGLPNRRQFKTLVEHELRLGQRYGQGLAALLVDVDHFKHINDRHGHDAGDDALRGIAALMRQALRGSDVLCRWGGEEFAVLLVNVDAASAREAAERLRQAVAAHEVRAASSSLHLTVSVGLALWDGVENLERLLHRADAALYQAKSGGRNQVHGADEAERRTRPCAAPALAG